MFEAAVARLDDEDLPVFAMLLDREPLDSIADAMRTDRAEIAWRAQRIIGRLRPRSEVAWRAQRTRYASDWPRGDETARDVA
jgi:hypothetical protein